MLSKKVYFLYCNIFLCQFDCLLYLKHFVYLSGTTWIADEEEERFTLIFAENTATFIYEFDANLDGVYDSSDEKETSIVNYSLNNNEITIIEGNSTVHGVITGNQLILSSDGDSITYYKK